MLLIDVANLAYVKHEQQSQNATQLIQKLSTPVTSNASSLRSSHAVTLIKFGDYLCAACYKFHADTEV
jgi:protein-disulfide isomerase